MAVDIGLWRSMRGDTHPHVGVDVEFDYWPQATHVVWEAPALITCVTGGGGGSQQAVFKSELDPLLAAALAHWQQRPVRTPEAALEQFFAEIQTAFDAQTEPSWADEFQATGAAVLIRDDGAAVGNVGLDRVYRWRDRRLEQLTEDDSLARQAAPAQVPEWFRETAVAGFRKAHPERADFNRWTITPIDVSPGDVLIVASGLVPTGMSYAYLTGALDAATTGAPLTGAQDLADRLGEIATRFAATSPPDDRVVWKVHSRLALAIAWVD